METQHVKFYMMGPNSKAKIALLLYYFKIEVGFFLYYGKLFAYVSFSSYVIEKYLYMIKAYSYITVTIRVLL